MNIGKKISSARRELGITQVELAEKMSVTRQTVSRWESGTALPDVEKVSQIASILNVSCDYLLNEEAISSNVDTNEPSISRLLENLMGKKVKLNFYEDEETDIFYDVKQNQFFLEDIDEKWALLKVITPKYEKQELIRISSIKGVTFVEENE